jgi:hypothetical protein
MRTFKINERYDILYFKTYGRIVIRDKFEQKTLAEISLEK